MGNSAAVQANIVVPGMAGTHSSVDIDQETRSTHTAGVGYQRGEPYAKWGRFTCETPTNRDPPRRSPGRQSWKSPRPRPRPSDGFETVGTMEQKNDSAVGGSGRDSCGVASAGNGNNGGAERVGTSRLTYNPSVSGGSAYLEVNMYTFVVMRVRVLSPYFEKHQSSRTVRVVTWAYQDQAKCAATCVSTPKFTSSIPLLCSPCLPSSRQTFLDVMAKAQAESCHTWQQVLETAPPPHVPASSGERDKVLPFGRSVHVLSTSSFEFKCRHIAKVTGRAFFTFGMSSKPFYVSRVFMFLQVENTKRFHARRLRSSPCFPQPQLQCSGGGVTALVDEQEPHFEHEPGLAHTAEDDTDPRLRNETRFEAQIGSEGLGEADKALHSILIATQDSFKRQLADMRENLNKVNLLMARG